MTHADTVYTASPVDPADTANPATSGGPSSARTPREPRSRRVSGEAEGKEATAAASESAKAKAPVAGRTSLSFAEQRKVWVRAGGCCVLCKRYLLEGALTGHVEVSLGELAHIVGQQNSERSPRGLHPMPRADRDLADNVLLACDTCHKEIDKQAVTGTLNVDTLRRLKTLHEQRIRHVTTLPDDRRSLVLRMVGELRGNAVEINLDTAVAAVIGIDRFPWFDLDRDQAGVEIDLRNLPGEPEADDAYYAAARKVVDRVLEHKLHDAVNSGDVTHISVFAFARLPLLVYLGSRLEDNGTVEVFQRHRSTQSWAWPDATPHTFTVAISTSSAGGDSEDTKDGAPDRAESAASSGCSRDLAGGVNPLAGTDQVVLLLSVSGTVDPAEIPVNLQNLPRITVTADGVPGTDTVTSRATLAHFTAAVREVNAVLDAHKNLRAVHVFGALPPSAAVELGRAHDPHIHPALVVYDRNDAGSYRPAMEMI